MRSSGFGKLGSTRILYFLMIARSTIATFADRKVQAIEVAIAQVFRRIHHLGDDQWVLELRLMPTKSGIVEVITVTPRGPQPGAMGAVAGRWKNHLEQLAPDLNCVVFEPRTTFVFGALRAPAVRTDV